jgi:hypothetical protein
LPLAKLIELSFSVITAALSFASGYVAILLSSFVKMSFWEFSGCALSFLADLCPAFICNFVFEKNKETKGD